MSETTHALCGDGLYNYFCTGCGWRYAHVGWGEPDDVAASRYDETHDEWVPVPSFEDRAKTEVISRFWEDGESGTFRGEGIPGSRLAQRDAFIAGALWAVSNAKGR